MSNDQYLRLNSVDKIAETVGGYEKQPVSMETASWVVVNVDFIDRVMVQVNFLAEWKLQLSQEFHFGGEFCEMRELYYGDNLIYQHGVTFHWPQSPSQAFSCFTSHRSHMGRPADASAPPTVLSNLILLIIQAVSSTFARRDSRWSSSIRRVHKWTGERLNFAPCSSRRSFFHKSFFLCNYSAVLHFWHSPLSNKPTGALFKK